MIGTRLEIAQRKAKRMEDAAKATKADPDNRKLRREFDEACARFTMGDYEILRQHEADKPL